MILAAGLSPAWQQTYVFDAVERGEVNRAQEAPRCASGKSVNVALAVAAVGAPARLLTVIGGGCGELLVADCRRHAIDCHFVRIRRETRVCTTLLDQARGEATELVEEMPRIEPDELEAFRAAYAAALVGAQAVVLSGSLPPGAPRGLIFEMAAQVAVPVVLDVRGAELREALAAQPWLVKPNRRELAATVGRELATAEEVFDAAEELRRAGAQRVVITDGARSLLAIDDRGARIVIEPPRVTVVNPIGCGDCLAAGLAMSAVAGEALEIGLRRGMALAAANAETLLPARFPAERPAELFL